MNSNNPFIDTYICISNLSAEEIFLAAKKYSIVSGININSKDLEAGNFSKNWKYLACTNNLNTAKGYTGIYVTDNKSTLPNHSKEITKEFLDHCLIPESKEITINQNLQQAQTEYPDFDFKISLKGMCEAEKVAAKQWIKETALAKFNNPVLDTLELDAPYYWVKKVNSKGVLHHSFKKSIFDDFGDNEIKLSFSTKVSSWSKDQSELWQRKTQLEEELAEINTELGLD